MATSPATIELQFGEFQANLRSRELYRGGAKVRLPDQSFQVLAMLLEHPGELVTREEIRSRLWPERTFVDFDHGLNNAVNRLREALGDSAESPRYVETLPRRGYRLIAPVDSTAPCAEKEADASETLPPQKPHADRVPLRRWSTWIAVASTAALMTFLAAPRFRSNRSTQSSIQSVAVLPLENLSGDASQEYVADGITDALITDLAQLGSVRVISRTSAMTYKGSRKSLAQTARELNVDAVVEGSVVRSGDRVRVTAQLIQVAPEQHLWARAYERDVADLVTLQGDVARAIADEVQMQLSPEARKRLREHGTTNPAAYNAYLMGRYFLDRAGKENLETALSYFQKAVQLDPQYALAWASVADTYRFLGGGGFVPAEQAIKDSRAAVERAIALDPSLAEAQAVMGTIQTFVDYDWSAASASFDRALALEPGNFSALSGAAFVNAASGRFDKALPLARRAVEVDPLNPRSHRLLGHIARIAGSTDEAIAAFHRSLQLDTNSPLVHWELGCIELARSNRRGALGEMEQEKFPEFRLLGLSTAHWAAGSKKESDGAMNELIAKYQDVSGFQIAEAYGYRGDRDRALQWLERAYAERDGALIGVKTDPLLNSIHDDPRYTAFLQKMHLPLD